MPTRVAQSDPAAQTVALDAYNRATQQLADAQAKLDQIQGGTRPADNPVTGHDTGGKQFDLDYKQAQSAVADAQAQAAAASRQYASILEEQAKTAAADTSGVNAARASQLQAQADYVRAKADGYAATTAAQQQAASDRAQAALTRAKAYADSSGTRAGAAVTSADASATRAGAAVTSADASASRADTAASKLLQYSTPTGLYQKDDTNPPYSAENPGWRQVTDGSGKPLPGSRDPAQTAQTNASTALTQQQIADLQARTPQELANLVTSGQYTQTQIDSLKAKLPGEVAGQAATTANTQATTQKTLQDIALAAIPKYGEATPTSGPMQSVTDPTTGKQTFQPNPNTADPIARQQQLHDQAQAKHDDLQKQVLNGAIQPDEALQQWNDYWANTIEPQRQQLQRAQDQQTYSNQLAANTDTRASQTLQQNQQNWNQDFASKAGDSAVKDMMDTLPYRVGPNMGADFAKGLNTLSSGGGAVSFSPGDFTYNMPDFENIRHQAVAHALKDISPYAASQIGAPTPTVPQNVDYTSALNQTSYGGSFAPAPPAQPAASPTTTIAPDGTITVNHVPVQGPSNSLDAVPQPSY